MRSLRDRTIYSNMAISHISTRRKKKNEKKLFYSLWADHGWKPENILF